MKVTRILILFVLIQASLCALNSPPAGQLTEVQEFYQGIGNQPVWFVNGALTPCGQTAIGVLKNVADDGLNPADYEDVIKAIEAKPLDTQALEQLLTRRFLEYIHHVREGRIDPRTLAHEIKIQSPKTDAIKLLTNALKSSDNCAALRNLAPEVPQYLLLRKKLAVYRALETHVPEWPTLSTSKKSIKVGMEDDELPTIRKILIYLGDLDEKSLTPEDLEDPVYDRTTAEAIKEFKVRYSMLGNDLIGPDTIKALSLSVKTLIKRIIINMERLRWLPDEMGERYIQVNVAGYEVTAVENNKIALAIPAIVGRPSRRTPLFYAKLQNVMINPSWGVPPGIMRADKIPKLINDPSYARRSGFTVSDSSGNVVDPESVDWESEGMSYHLRQGPGARNALGRVKFNIDNPYIIYLHGTPEDKLFRKQIRTFSSGCVRIQDPVSLADWVLKGKDDWSKDQINSTIKAGKSPAIQPVSDIMVYFTYMSLWVDEQGRVRVSNDPYRFDPRVEKALGL